MCLCKMQDTLLVKLLQYRKSPKCNISRPGTFINQCCSMKCNHANGFNDQTQAINANTKRKHQTLTLNANTKRKHQTLTLMGATRLVLAFDACVQSSIWCLRFKKLRIPPNYLVLMSILNTLPHNARLPRHVVSAVSHRLLWVVSITKNTSSAATHTINAHFVQSTSICL